jgi:hypothetical protein
MPKQEWEERFIPGRQLACVCLSVCLLFGKPALIHSKLNLSLFVCSITVRGAWVFKFHSVERNAAEYFGMVNRIGSEPEVL